MPSLPVAAALGSPVSQAALAFRSTQTAALRTAWSMATVPDSVMAGCVTVPPPVPPPLSVPPLPPPQA